MSVEPVGDRWYATDIIRFGGHSTIRVVLFDESAHDRLEQSDLSVGLLADHTEINGFFAIDVPPEHSFALIRELLREGQQDGSWDVDEGSIADGHLP